VRPAAAPVWVSADPQLLRVAVSNLVNNALDALSTRRPSSRAPRVELSVEAGAGVARLSVADNGDGVLPAIRPRLFEPFQSGKTSGVGIGLALAKRVAKAHGGDLELLASTPGAVFCISLPLERP
jgi:signal transduction histidine kinase